MTIASLSEPEHSAGLRGLLAGSLAWLLLLAAPTPNPAQVEGSARASAESVTPVFEGWYENPDGTYSLQFGYFSRSAEAVVEIPLGPDNFIVPEGFDGGQPTHFLPRPGDRGPGRGIRHWGVFTVVVPEDFGAREVVWTLRNRGDALSVPGHLREPGYELAALGENHPGGVRPPRLRLDPEGPEGTGPGGVRSRERAGVPGSPLELTAWAVETSGFPTTLRWFKHQGPGEVTFARRRLRIDPEAERATTTATFSEPGEYVLRVRATNPATEFDRYCCWTNGYVGVIVEGGPPPAEDDVDADVDSNRKTPSRSRAATEVAPGAGRTDPGLDRYPPGDGSADRAKRGGSGAGNAPSADLPALPYPERWPEEEEAFWRLSADLGPPEMVFRSAPHTVPGSGPDRWTTSLVETGLSAPRWVRAVEVRPSSAGRPATHHVVLAVYDALGRRVSLLTEWAPGKIGEVMSERTGRLLDAGASIEWDIHYAPAGRRIVSDQVEVALWFHPEGYEPELENYLRSFRVEPTDGAARGAHLDIPPGEVTRVEGVHVLDGPARIESFQPHMHRRGAAMAMEAIYPDGSRELLGSIERFQQGRTIHRAFPEHAMPLLPAGTRIVLTAWHDNSKENSANPDFRQWVGFGRRTVDEMAHAWVSVTPLTQDQYEELSRERREGR